MRLHGKARHVLTSLPLNMGTRQPVDWALTLHRGEPLRTASADGTRSGSRERAIAFQELAACTETDAVLRRAVELARESIGAERAAIFLIDPAARLMVGTWGTDLERRTVDEHHVMYEWSEDGREIFRRAAEEGVPWTLIENSPTLGQIDGETRLIARAWVACTPIFSARRPIGMMFNDSGRLGTPVDEERQGLLAILCAFVGVLVDVPSESTEPAAPYRRTSPLVSAVVQELAGEPWLPGTALARKHKVSLSRLARAFKTEMGISIVEHRNRLRLKRFFHLIAAGYGLSPAALEAGFGSYAQFHRVFRALYECSPAAYLARRDRDRLKAPSPTR